MTPKRSKSPLEDLEHLAGLWRDHPAPEPSDAAWEAVLVRVEMALASASGRPAGRRSRFARLSWVLAAMAAAAAVLLAVRPFVLPNRFSPQPAAEQDREESFAVLADDEVEILSIQADDASGLVVGEPPVREPVIMASAEDISLHHVEPDADGMIPDSYSHEPSGPGMIVAPLGTKD